MTSTRDDTLTAIYARGDHLRSRRRRRRVAVLGAGAVACIVAGALLWPRTGHRRQSVATTPATNVASASASDLATGTWTVMPDPPAAWEPQTMQGAWDGRELVVWGVLGDRTLGAAAFDPASRAWRTIPAPPLAPRVNASVVWTGSEIVVWGGIGYQSQQLFDDGAAYDPARSSWRPLAPGPLSARSGASMVWTGHEVVVLGGLTLDGSLVDGARYDPVSDEWQETPDIPGGVHDIDMVTSVWAGDRLVVANAHQTISRTSSATTGATTAISFYSYDPASGAWTTLATEGAPLGVDDLVWTGSAVLSVPARSFCGAASCPSFPAPPGALLDLRNDSWRTIAAGPIDDAYRVNLWTGSALLLAGASVDAAAWDATADTWSRLPEPPLSFTNAAVRAWTGHEALFWGTALDDRGSRPAGAVFTPYTKPALVPTTPEDVAAQLQSVQGVDPVLVPTAVPAGWHADVSVRDAGYDVTYTGPDDQKVHLSVTIPNPPPPSPTGTQAFGFRADPRALYQQYDATDPFTDRNLEWNEPGHWAGDSTAAPPRDSVPYYLWATGVTDSVFRQIADSLTPLPSVH